MTAGTTDMLNFKQVFDSDGGDYTFVMSHVGLSGRDVAVRLEAGKWVLTQRSDGREWTVRHEDKTCAVLLLIAARMGFTGELHPIGG